MVHTWKIYADLVTNRKYHSRNLLNNSINYYCCGLVVKILILASVAVTWLHMHAG